MTMIRAIIFALLVLPSGSAQASKPLDDETFIQNAMTIGCRGNLPTREMVVELLAIEKDAGFPLEIRGLLVAAACNESGFNPQAGGDRKDILTGMRCRTVTDTCRSTSIGLMQFKPWAKKKIVHYGSTTSDPRYDWRASAKFWTTHVAAQVVKVRQKCPEYKRGWNKDTSIMDVWRAAHRTAVTAPKCYRWSKGKKKYCKERGPRCHRLGRSYTSSHWRILASWNGKDVKVPAKFKDYPRAVNPKAPKATEIPSGEPITTALQP